YDCLPCLRVQVGKHLLEGFLIFVTTQILSVGAIDHDEHGVQVLERIERVERAAELIESRTQAQSGKSLGQYLGLFEIGDGIALGDLNDQRIPWQARCLECRPQPWQQGRIVQAGARQVDKQPCAVALAAMFGEQLDGVEQHPAIDLGSQSGFLRSIEENAGRYFSAFRVKQTQQYFVVLVVIAAQADDRLEQQAETVLLQRLLHHRKDIAAAGSSGQFVGRIVDVQCVAVGQFFGAAVGAVDDVACGGGLLIEAGSADAEGCLYGASGDLEQMPFDLLQQFVEQLLALLSRAVGQQGGEGVIAEACELG